MRHLLLLIVTLFCSLHLLAQDTDEDGGWQPAEPGREDVTLLKGSASYAYPIWTPAGRGGANLPLQLVYNSAVVNSMSSEKYTDTGWVGVGWQLELPRISVKDGKEGHFSISLNGVASALLPAADGFLYPEEHPFIRVEKYDAQHDAPEGETDDLYFVATEKNGTRYFFGEANGNDGLPIENSGKASLGFTRGSGKQVYRVFKLWKIEDRHGNTLRITYGMGYTEQDQDDHGHPNNMRKESHPISLLYTTNPAQGDTVGEYEVSFDILGKSHPIESAYGEVKQYLAGIHVRHHDQGNTRTLFNYTLEYSQFGSGHEAGKHIRLDRIHRASEDAGLGVETTEFGYEIHPINTTIGFQNPSDCGPPPAPFPCGQGRTDTYQRTFLKSIDDFMGKQILFTYGPHPAVRPRKCTDYWGDFRTDFFPVVSRKIVIDKIMGSQAVTDYHYIAPQMFTRISNQDNDIYSANFGTFGGFSKVWVVDPEDKVSQQQFKVSVNLWDCDKGESAPLGGRLTATTLYPKATNRNPDMDGDGQVDGPAYARISNTWVQWGGNPGNYWPEGAYFIYNQNTINTRWGLSYPQSQFPDGVWTQTSKTYDDYGNPTLAVTYETSTENPSLITPTVKRTKYVGYKPHPNRWLVLKSFENLYKGVQSNDHLVASKVYLYDTDGSAGSHDFNMLGMLSPNSIGQLNRLRVWNDERVYVPVVPPIPYDGFSEVSYTYDGFGNILTQTSYADEGKHWLVAPFGNALAGEVHNRITNTYGPHHLFATSTLTEGADGFGNQVSLNFSSADFDWGLQLKTSVTDALGRTSATGYDAFMRPIYTMKPIHYEQGVATTTTSYPSYLSWSPALNQPFTLHEVKVLANGQQESYSYFDALGRQIQTQLLTETTHPTYDSFLQIWSVSATRFDSLGRAAETLPPTAVTKGGPLPVVPLGYLSDPYSGRGTSNNSYNSRGQLDWAIEPNNMASNHFQDVDVTTSYHQGTYLFLEGSVGADGQARHKVLDAEGKLVLVREWDTDDNGDYRLEGETHYRYDVAGNLLTITDAHGNVFETVYDQAGRKIRMDDPDLSLGGAHQYSYDAMGNLVQHIDSRSVVTSLQYDGLNRVVNKHWNTPGDVDPSEEAGFYYDNDLAAARNSFGHLQRVEDMDGSEHLITYDRWQRPYTTRTNLAGRYAPYAQGMANPLVQRYNDDDQTTLEIRPDNSVLEFAYSGENGQAKSVHATMAVENEDFNSTPLDSAWDIREYTEHIDGTLVATGTDGNAHLAFYQDDVTMAASFDFKASMNTRGSIYLSSAPYSNPNHRRLELAVKPDGNGTFKLRAQRLVGQQKVSKQYMAYGLRENHWYRAVLMANPHRSGGYAIVVYDLSDSESMVVFQDTVPANEQLGFDGSPIRFACDIADDQLTVDNVTLLATGEAVGRVEDFDHIGRPVTVALPGGLTRTNTYGSWQDDNNRLTQINVHQGGTLLMEQNFSYTNAGNLERIDDYQTMDGAVVYNGSHNYSYDDLHRLKSATVTNLGETLLQTLWDYDALGNIQSVSDGVAGTLRQYQYGTRGGPHAVDTVVENGVEILGFQYDNNGNSTTWGDAQLSYRAANQPGNITRMGGTWSYHYDGNQVRRLKQHFNGSGQLQSANLYLNNLERQFDTATQISHTRHQINLGGMLVATWENGKMATQHPNQLGTMLMTTDPAGEVLFWERARPFGGYLVSGGKDQTDLDFTGQRKDVFAVDGAQDTFLLDFSARRYDAGIGRFISPDTLIPDLSNPQALNRYSYVYNNPLHFTDSSGHFPDPEEVKKCIKEGCDKSVFLDLSLSVEADIFGGFYLSTGLIFAYNYNSGTIRIGRTSGIGGNFGTPEGVAGTASAMVGETSFVENNDWVPGMAVDTSLSGGLDYFLQAGGAVEKSAPISLEGFSYDKNGNKITSTAAGGFVGFNTVANGFDGELTVGASYTTATPEIPIRGLVETLSAIQSGEIKLNWPQFGSKSDNTRSSYSAGQLERDITGLYFPNFSY